MSNLTLPLIGTRNELVDLINKFNLKKGVEIGVCEGEFSDHLLSKSNLDVLYSIDAWDENMDNTLSAFKRCDLVEGKIEGRYKKSVERLSKHGTRSKIIRKLSFDAVEDFEDGSLDFIYLDASHRFTGFAMDMIQWWPKLRNGGLYAGHDFWGRYRYETHYVVSGFCLEHKQFYRLTTNERHDFPASWYLLKEQNTKEQYFSRFAEEVKLLKQQAEEINAKCLFPAYLPYEYHRELKDEVWGLIGDGK